MADTEGGGESDLSTDNLKMVTVGFWGEYVNRVGGEHVVSNMLMVE